MNAQSFPNSGLGRQGNAGDHFNCAFDNKPKRLGGNPTLIKPSKNTIDQNSPKTLSQQSSNHPSPAIPLFCKTQDIRLHSRPKRSPLDHGRALIRIGQPRVVNKNLLVYRKGRIKDIVQQRNVHKHQHGHQSGTADHRGHQCRLSIQTFRTLHSAILFKRQA